MQMIMPNFLLTFMIVISIIYGAFGEPERRPTFIPTVKPSLRPTPGPTTRTPTFAKPTRAPNTARPTVINNGPSQPPTSRPTMYFIPTSRPTEWPSRQPSSQPSSQPSNHPSMQPTSQPTTVPSRPTHVPTFKPSVSIIPTRKPSFAPTFKPTSTALPTFFKYPTGQPTSQPSRQPSTQPSRQPSCQPSSNPTSPSGQPTSTPTREPTTRKPTPAPTSVRPSIRPSSVQPTSQPSQCPSGQPISKPTRNPQSRPTSRPTRTHGPSGQPSMQPSNTPSEWPSSRPSASPSFTHQPSKLPSGQPSSWPSSQPSRQPTGHPTCQPSTQPTNPTGQPTRQPSGQPSSQPSSHPSTQPSRQPTRQPSSQPSSNPTNPTGQPSGRPSQLPSAQPSTVPTVSSKPTVYYEPTSQPSSGPSGQPSSYPSVVPTLTYYPSSRPSAVPRSRPTSRPTWSEGDFTNSPTAEYQNIGVSGAVRFDPDSNHTCGPIEIQIDLQFSRNLSAGSIFTISAPGITSGPCYSPVDGVNKNYVYISNNAFVTASFTEGSYVDNYATSKFRFYVTNSLLSTVNYMHLVIDRSNALRSTCTLNNTWIVNIQPVNRALGLSGFIDKIDTYSQRCINFYSSISFTNGIQQFPTGINISMHFGYSLMSGTVIRISLPGFTNARGGYGMNDMLENSTDVIGNGQDSSLFNLTWGTNYTWIGQYFEGSYQRDYVDSRIELTTLGHQFYSTPIWVHIPMTWNMLIPTAGSPVNYTGFTISSMDPYSYTPQKVIDSSEAIGEGCSKLSHCNKRGKCDYKHNVCQCDDGYGSVKDRQYSIAQDFQPDCSSKACPTRPSIGSVFMYSNLTSNVTNMHGLMECSNNGLCTRSTGTCRCSPGYYGAACQKMRCHASCSNRGVCKSMKRLATSATALPLSDMSYVDYVATNKTDASDSAWDSDFGHQCVCDSSWPVGLGANETQASEFFGIFCQYRHCPSGDDPDTIHVDETNCTGLAVTNNRLTKTTIGRVGNKCHVDCSNRGSCDFSSGLCKCYSGYGGDNCGSRLAYVRS